MRVTASPTLQAAADRALRHGLSGYDRRHGGWRGPVGPDRARQGDQGWQAELGTQDPGFELGDWRRGVVLAARGKRVEIGLEDGDRMPPLRQRRRLDRASAARRRAISVVMEAMGEADARRWVLRQRPAVEGAVVALDPHTGRVLAMSGGFSYRQSKFNRATQAQRQPGSAFKPFVYLAALESGMTPVSMVLDAPITLDQGPGLPHWQPENFSDDFLGPITLRVGLEKSRNLISVRVAADRSAWTRSSTSRTGSASAPGCSPISRRRWAPTRSRRSSSPPPTPMLVNGGKKIEPVLVERDPGPPRPDDRARRPARLRGLQRSTPGTARRRRRCPTRARRSVDPRNAYQMVSMLEGVVAARHRQGRAGDRASRWPARPAPPTTARTPGSSASRPISWWRCSSASTSRSRMGKQRDRRHRWPCRSGSRSCRRRWRTSRRRRSARRPGSASCGSTPPPGSSPARPATP